MGFAANSHGSAMSPDQEPQRAPTSSTSPHPRHRSHCLRDDCWYLAGTQHYHDYEYHLVDNDFDPAPHDNDPAPDDHDGPTAGRDDTPDGASTSSDSVLTGHRRSDREALVPVRSGRGAVGDRDRLARVELPTRRRQPHEMLVCVSDGFAPTCRHLRSSRLSGLVRGSIRRGSQHRLSSVAVCVLGILTLAALIWKVL